MCVVRSSGLALRLELPAASFKAFEMCLMRRDMFSSRSPCKHKNMISQCTFPTRQSILNNLSDLHVPANLAALGPVVGGSVVCGSVVCGSELALRLVEPARVSFQAFEMRSMRRGMLSSVCTSIFKAFSLQTQEHDQFMYVFYTQSILSNSSD